MATGSSRAAADTPQTRAERLAAPSPRRLRPLGCYGLALLLVGGAALLHWTLSAVPDPSRLLVFGLACIGAAAYGGLGPGLLATVASWLCVELLFDSNPGHIAFGDPMLLIERPSFLVGGLAVSLVGEKMRRVRMRLRRHAKELAAANRALQASEEKYRLLVEKINDWVWEIDASGVYTYSSPRVQELLGYTPEEIVGKTPFDLMPPAEAQRVRDVFEPVWLARKPLELLDNTLVRKDGRLVTVETSGMPVFAEDVTFQGYAGIDRDVTARKQAEETLRESEEKFRLLAETSPAAILIYQDSKLVYLNPAVESITGYTCDELIGRALWSVIHPDYRQKVEQLASHRARGKGLPTRYELKIITKDGQERWIDQSSISILYGHKPAGMVVAFDITNRKRAEEALREHQQMISAIVESSHDWIWTLDLMGRHTYSSQAVEAILGYSAAEFLGMGLDLVHPEDRRIVEARWPSWVEARQGWRNLVLRWRAKDGSYRYLESTAVPLLGSQSELLGFCGVDRDITERQQAEEVLRRSEEKFRLLAETSPAAILIYQDGKYVYANPAAESLTGYNWAELLQQTPGELVHPDYREQVKQMVSLRAQGESPPAHYDLKILTKEGQERWLESETVSIMYGDKPAGLVVAFDVTERKQAEDALHELAATLESRVAQRTAELRERARQLQKLTLELTEAESRERKRLAGILHDDLQQILAAAKFHLGIVSERCKDDETLRETTGQIRQMLVEAIGKSRNLSHELSPPGLARSDLREAFEWLAEQMQSKHGLTVRVEVGDQIVLQSEPLKALLFKAARELLFNVVKHAEVREARLQLYRRRGTICLVVSDMGCGFDSQKTGKTLGFGLLNLRERVDLLGGRMKIRSTEGKGTTFRIVVPDTPL